MANRNTLHISKLEAFKNWLIKDGWEILPLSKNPYEVLRASKMGISNPLIVYSGKSKEHLSFANEWLPVLEAFLHKKTNADRIRSMTDEELLDFICSIETYDEDSMRFIRDCEKAIGKEIEVLRSAEYGCVEECVRAFGGFRSAGNGFAPCTNWLKKRVRKQWEQEHKQYDLIYDWGLGI